MTYLTETEVFPQAPACTATPSPAPRPVEEQEELRRTEGPRPIVTPGRCSTGQPRCGKTARLFPCGWRCEDHQPGAT